MSRRVLVVDDEKGIRDALRQLLEYEEIEVKDTDNGYDAIELYAEFSPHLVLLDVKMEGLDGLAVLDKLIEIDPRAHVVMISGHGTIQTAVEATQRGAYDFLEKPLDTDRILLTLKRTFEHVDLAAENKRLKSHVTGRHHMVGSSKRIQELLDVIDKVAPTPSRVLITGENGSGKELVARSIHEQSPRNDNPFVEVNCAAIPGELIESELFGHMKGSFTGATADRAGKFEQADGGTLFLDEIGDMSLAAQAKVLRVLEEGAVTRIGAARQIKVDVRVLAATNKNVEEEISEARFREDLYYRLNVVPISVPPLRVRLSDIPELVAHFAADLTTNNGFPARTFSAGALAALTAHDWPGNIRELRNTVERLLILSSGSEVTARDVEALAGSARRADLGGLFECETFDAFKQEAERAYLSAKLAENNWNVSETARKLDMPRSNFYKKIERYDLKRGE